ncbi:dihydrofolate reductase family protein [Streptomyces sp. NPDC006529]|uniref:dihydrofolate reductase family protein n=1 Tax=Streptomyces sp. NPDC006529 TaxID=3157177 RepID=UPI0033BA913D
MRKIILMMSVSLDGYIEDGDRQIDWHQVDDELHRHLNDEIRAMGGLLEGRTTYELMEDYWSTADTDPADTGPTADFARIWRDTPKYVYSRTLQQAGPNATIVRDVVPEEVAALKAAPGGDLGLGGAHLAASFLAHDLVDAYRIYVHPVRIGRGTPLFLPVDTPPAPLHLEGTHTFTNGVVELRYGRQ